LATGDPPKLKAARRLARVVTLAEVKQDKAFADWALVRISRLSVMPVPPALYRRLLMLAG
jgi:predicted RNA-binding protein with PUA-like domain